VGIDLAQVATSDGRLVVDGRYGRKASAALAAAQRELASKQRGSRHRERSVERVAGAHRKIRHQRKDLAHKVSRDLVNRYDLIVHEDLAIANMVRRPRPRQSADGSYEPNGAGAKAGLNRSISDAGWGQLLQFIAYKAEDAGRAVIAVDPRLTPNSARRASTWTRRTGERRLHSNAGRVATRPTPT
jgi:putative transposase